MACDLRITGTERESEVITKIADLLRHRGITNRAS